MWHWRQVIHLSRKLLEMGCLPPHTSVAVTPSHVFETHTLAWGCLATLTLDILRYFFSYKKKNKGILRLLHYYQAATCTHRHNCTIFFTDDER
jgi:hypothetical protein